MASHAQPALWRDVLLNQFHDIIPGSSIARVAMMPGTAQAKLDSSGMKARPCRPAPPMILSIRKAARAM